MSVAVHIRNIEKNFRDQAVLQNVSLTVEAGELLALLGPSGSGKTTLLRTIAGLEFQDGGNVLFGDIDASQLSLRERRIGFVFQHYALFRHMTVEDNIAFGLRARPRKQRPGEAEIQKRVFDLLQLVQLDGLEKRYPTQLSGGQRQRVALARALAIEPRVLLLDEPFGALDAKIRKDLRQWLRDLHHRIGHTTVFVTHDQDEAFELADRVAILNQGRIEQVGTPGQIRLRPANAFVADFLGQQVAHQSAQVVPMLRRTRPSDDAGRPMPNIRPLPQG
jgi:sulfate transport system ATP-binding protein